MVIFEYYVEQKSSIGQNQEPYKKILNDVYHTLDASKLKDKSLASDGWSRAITIDSGEVCEFLELFEAKYRFLRFLYLEHISFRVR